MFCIFILTFQTNDALIAPLLRLNHCHLLETETTLKKYKKYSELIILYQTKGLHSKALELLQKQSNDNDSNLKGPERTIQYLQNIGNNYFITDFNNHYFGCILSTIISLFMK